MLNRSVLLILGIAASAAMSWSDAAVARLTANGIHLVNGIHLANGIHLSNGINLSNGQAISNTAALEAVRLALPDGTEVNFR
jgi:hypothetical protein